MSDNNCKVAVVTGADRGIGLSIVKLILIHHPEWIVYLTSKNSDRGNAAVQCLKQEHKVVARYHQLDIESADSIRTFKSFLVQKHPRGLDILVNNASIFPEITFSGNYVDVTSIDNLQKTLKVNFFSTANFCAEFLPLVSIEGRIVNVSSRLSQIAFANSSLLIQERIKNCFSIDEIAKLIKDFQRVDPLDYETDGWLTTSPFSEVVPGVTLGSIYPYAMSKIGLNLLTRAYQNEFRSKNFRVLANACCPGFINNEGCPKGDLVPDQCADSIFYLADLPRDSKHFGDFVAERKSIGFFQLVNSDLEFFLNMMK